MTDEVATDPIAVHQAAYERLIRAQEESNEAFLDLEEARKGVIDHLAGELAHVKGIAVRSPSPTGAAAWMPGMVAPPIEDPLRALVEVSESRYYQSLGRDAPSTPLAIQIVNNHTLLGLECPNCGEVLTSSTARFDVLPKGTRGR